MRFRKASRKLRTRQIAAWLVHLYTGLGGVIGMYALVMAARGEVRVAFLLMVATTLIDGTDGLLARQIRVWEILPQFDGSMIDNMIDTLTFLWVPVFIMANENLLPHPAWLVVPVVSGLYAYGQVNMKTEDSFFLGFPSYWNVIALYMFWLTPGAALAVVMVVVPGILSFVPTRYLYPSKNRILWQWSWGLAIVWIVLAVYLLLQEDPSRTLILISLFYPAYYLVASFWVDWRIRRGELRARRSRILIPPEDE